MERAMRGSFHFIILAPVKFSYLLTYLLTYSLTHSLTHSLIPCYRIFFEKSIVTQLAFFMEPEGSLPHSQMPVTGLYPEPAESSLPPRSPSV